MTEPTHDEQFPEAIVDVTIPVHTASRPIRRAVSSVLSHTSSTVSVNVIAHNVDPEKIRANLGEFADHPRLRLLSLQDGIASPAGPMNLGFDHSTAPFVSLLGSDDEFAPGALDSWLAVQAETGATTVIPKIIIIGRPMNPLPPLRGGRRTRRLNADRDRLSYRTAPLGLIDRRRFKRLRFTEGLASGEDIAYSAELWFTGSEIAVDWDGPAYLCHEDAGDRVTSAPREVATDFAFIDAIEAAPWFSPMRRADRVALIVKILRIHFLDAVVTRASSEEGLVPHQSALQEVFDRLRRMGPGAPAVLSRVDHRILREAFSETPSPERIQILAHDRWNQRSFGALLTPNPMHSLHRHAMIRLFYAANRTSKLDHSPR